MVEIMKVLIVANDSDGLIKFRGLLLKNFIQSSYEVACIIPLNDKCNRSRAENELKNVGCKLFFVRMDQRGMNPNNDIKLFLNYKKIIKSWMPQLVLTYTIKPNIYAGLACRFLKVPYVENITGLGTAFQNDGILKKMVIFMYKQALVKTKLVFFENIENRDVMVNLGIISKEKSHVLAGAGVDLEYFSYLDYPDEEKKTRFLFIGRVMKENGINELFFALEKLNSSGIKCTLDMLGRYEENYSKKLKKYEDAGWLQYYGVQEDVRPYIKRCHCFVLPSWHEGMANTNLENASCGRPIITSRIHGCLEAVIEGKTGYLCESKNVESLIKAMQRFIELPYEEKKKMGIEGRKYMEIEFDKKKVVAETLNFIKSRI